MTSTTARRRPAEPIARFYRLIPDCPLPMRADRSAGGVLPTRAYRFCDAVTTASGFGWYLFPPTTLSVMWDGESVLWRYEGEERWLPLSAAQYPDFRRHFDAHAPADIGGFSPPFIGALNEPGIIQIWSGYAIRTAPGWSIQVRPMVNFPGPAGYEMFEGIIETDTWFGPIFGNIRLKRTDTPVVFRRDLPLFHIQPIPQYVYADDTLNAFEVVPDLASFDDADWARYRDTVVKPNIDPERRHGRYAVTARRRRKVPAAEAACPFAGAKPAP